MDGQADWLRAWRECFGKLPDSYLVIDTETTGLSPADDLIVQLGWCEVQNRRVVDNAGVVLNWLGSDAFVPEDEFLGRLERTRKVMESKGNYYPWTPEVIRGGDDPLVCLADLLFRIEADHVPCIVTHNGWSFDAPMLESHFRRFLYRDYYFNEHRMLDTGAIEKGSQLGLTPQPDDSLRDFTRRVMQRRSTIKWSLANHCVPRYDLARKHNLDLDSAHTAPFDCYVTHLLLETYRGFMPEEGNRCGSTSAMTSST